MVRIGRCCQAGVLGSSAERPIQPFISKIDSLNLDQAVDDSDLYELEFNPSHPS
ncbi:hypothetical protein RHMOL_Rhmol11G0069000 [Rhododendron molle]|uniref:Uncharacterized protein n=1 Tax=Rhododendron molle TaxID=49168 RepID=A0ACC0LPR4_RHOML|nr:hypothetical protein RHMOL_Rhmol11G0069000 [Rhododendron molle]